MIKAFSQTSAYQFDDVYLLATCVCFDVVAFQDGTSEDDHLGGAVEGSDVAYVFAGITRGDWSGTNAGGYDWAAFKADAQGDILWSWQVTKYL